MTTEIRLVLPTPTGPCKSKTEEGRCFHSRKSLFASSHFPESQYLDLREALTSL